MSIKVTALSKEYGQQKAVDNLSFEAHPGKILGLLGPNGAGKSTTMKMLAGYLNASSGSIEICGFDIAEHSLEARKATGYLPENTPLYTDMYVKEFLLFIAGMYKLPVPAEKVKQVINSTGLGAEQRKKISNLSKGYKQRVGLAQAIIHDPKVLILDEPTSGLDPNQLTEIRSLIKGLGKDKTVILSTHIMQEVEAICDEVIIINKGVVVASGSVSALKIEHQMDSLEDIFRKVTG